MPPPPLAPGKFVESSRNSLGVGRIVEITEESAVVEYFDSPIALEHPKKTLPLESLSDEVILEPQTRVYFYDKEDGFWRMGRVQGHVDETVYVALPQQRTAEIPQSETFVRWNRALGNPWEHLQGRLTETSYFHSARSDLIAELIEQRTQSGGMTALLSAPIELELHQIEVINRVLKDPVQRYLLADEVGLGKTIEAGVILRQHILDNPDTHRALVVVPKGLVGQWENELRRRCQISPDLFNHRVEVLSYGQTVKWQGDPPDFIIVDEAHRIVIHPALYDQLRHLSDPDRCPKLLLLSATPVLRNEEGFLKLLHLLDPLLYKLEDTEAFKELVSNRQNLANLFGEFMEDQDPYFLSTVIQDLRDEFPTDSRLDSLLAEVERQSQNAQNQAALENPPELKRSISRARNHLSESYRLHRRILRNRRSADLESVLTGRNGILSFPFSDPSTARLENELENWRIDATNLLAESEDTDRTQALATLYLHLVEAACCDPLALLDIVRTRRNLELPGDRDHGSLFDSSLKTLLATTPLFEGEKQSLDRVLGLEQQLDLSRRDRITFLSKNLLQGVLQEDPRLQRVVFFCTSPAFANDLYTELSDRYGDRVTRHGHRGWTGRWWRKGAQFLVCDWTAEEGLNLQGGSVCLIHVDLPFSPNRMEQRIGRLDRFGVGASVRSFALEPEDCRYASCWQDCLTNGWQVFSRSIAALQYVVTEEIRNTSTQIFWQGTTAIEESTERLSGEEGIQKELRLIRNQDALDAIETSSRDDSIALLDQLEALEKFAPRFGEVVDSWTISRLQFMRAGMTHGVDDLAGIREDPVFRYHYRSTDHGRQTLLPRSAFLKWFDPVSDPEADHHHFTSPLSFPMTFSRREAQRRGSGLARLGNPWIEALMNYARQDDRGSAFALWRQVDSTIFPAGTVGRVFFRLDYLIESGVDHAADAVTKRVADFFFPPRYETLWIDQDLSLPEGDLRDTIEEPFDSSEDGNMRAEHWDYALRSLSIENWSALCEEVREVAEDALRNKINLQEITEQARQRFEGATTLVQEQAKSRLEIFGKEHDSLDQGFAEQAQMAETVQEAIEKSLIRLDSCGAVFLATIPLEIPEETETEV